MASQAPKCSYISQSGAACLAYAVKNSPYCFYHDPSPEAKRKREKCLLKGAKRPRTDGIGGWVMHPIESGRELRTALSELFNAGMSGEVSTNRLSALASVANSLSKAIQAEELEGRVKALEAKERTDSSNDMVPLILEVMDQYPEAKMALLRKLEKIDVHTSLSGLEGNTIIP